MVCVCVCVCVCVGMCMLVVCGGASSYITFRRPFSLEGVELGCGVWCGGGRATISITVLE